MSGEDVGLAQIPDVVDLEEPLGRGVFSSKHFKKGDGAPAKVLARAFEPPKNSENPNGRIRDISVDRFAYLSEESAVELGEKRAASRNLTFYGWAIIETAKAKGNGREVVAAPEEQNPAHANIRLPESTMFEDEERDDHLMMLAEVSWLKEKP